MSHHKKPRRPRDRTEFEVAIICALLRESDAIVALLDGCWEDGPDGFDYGKAEKDTNTYKTGWIGKHNVVVAYMPSMGKKEASGVAPHLSTSFPRLRLGLLVGVCGGNPAGRDTGTEPEEILLGDVVVSTGVVEYDFGRQCDDGFKARDSQADTMPRPNQEIRSFLHRLQGKKEAEAFQQSTVLYLREILKKEEFESSKYPGMLEDRAYDSHHRHKHPTGSSCQICCDCNGPNDPVCDLASVMTCKELGCKDDGLKTLSRKRKWLDAFHNHNSGGSLTPASPIAESQPSPGSPEPRVHFGLFASGSAVIKSSTYRDHLTKRFGVIGFEMEGAGVWDHVPTVIVKVVCDYADSHKSKAWQDYAAAAAAACSKAFLDRWPVMNARLNQTLAPGIAAEKFRTPDEKKCLEKLFFTEMYTRTEDIKEAAPRTCEWILAHSKYKTWLDQGHGLIWIKGKPGAGKSTLLKYALEHATRQTSNNRTWILASFFFHDRGSENQKNPIGLFRSIIHQILTQSPKLLRDFTAIYTKNCIRHGQKWEWSIQQLRSFLKRSIEELSKFDEQYTIQLYVDALDECAGGEETAVELIEYFDDLISSLIQSDHGCRLAICFSCREYPITSWNPSRTIHVQCENGNDIEDYVHSKVQTMFDVQPEAWGMLSHSDEVNNLKQEITKKACGVFQWVVLVIPRLRQLKRRGYSMTAIQRELHNTPSELYELYGTILKFLEPEQISLSLTLFRWVCFAVSPLSVSELRFGLMLDRDVAYRSIQEYPEELTFVTPDDDMKKRIISLSGGLIEVNQIDSRSTGIVDGKSKVQFIHQSVDDYLKTKGLRELENYPANLSWEGFSHSRIALACARHFDLQEILQVGFTTIITHNPFKEALDTYPLLSYAIINWGIHANIAEREVFYRSIYLPTRLLRLSPGKHISLVHIFAAFGLKSSIEALMIASGSSMDLNIQDDCGQTPICWAASEGHQQVVQFLLNQDVSLESGTLNGETALQLAIYRGKENAFEILGMKNSMSNAKSETSAWYTSQRGYEGVVKLLLDHGATATRLNRYNHTPIFLASSKGYNAIAELILNKDTTVINRGDSQGETPFSVAALTGNQELVHILLSKGALADKPNLSGQTPLSRASEKGLTSIVKLLLARTDVQRNSKDIAGNSPLLHAAQAGHLEAVQLLLNCTDIQVNLENRQRDSPLLNAISGQFTQIVALLLQRDDIKVKTRDVDGSSALSRAASIGNVKMVNILLDYHDIKGYQNDAPQIEPLLHAVRGGHVAIQEILLNRLDIEATLDIEGLSILAWAIEHSYIHLIRLLLQRNDVDLTSQDRSGLTPLLRSFENGSVEVVKLLLDRITIEDFDASKRGELLLKAFAMEDDSMIESLVQRPDVLATIKDGSYMTPLHLAVKMSKYRIVQCLMLRDDIDVNAQDDQGESPLLLAAKKFGADMVNLAELVPKKKKNSQLDLLPAGTELSNRPANTYDLRVFSLVLDGSDIDVGITNTQGQTLLSYIIEHDLAPLLEHLLNKKELNMNTEDDHGRNPLVLAAERDSYCVAGLLIRRHDLDMNMKDARGDTPLLLAVEKGHLAMARLLLQKQETDVNAHNAGGSSPLHIAISFEDCEMVSLLLERTDLDVNTLDSDDRSPLSIAIAYKHYELVSILLQREDIDVNAHNAQEKSVLFQAIEQQDYAMMKKETGGVTTRLEEIDALLQHGSDTEIPDYLRESPLVRLINEKKRRETKAKGSGSRDIIPTN